MSLRPSATITLGRLQYTEQAAAIAAALTTLPGVNSVTVSLPAGVRFEAAPDDDGMLALDSGDPDGAGADTVLTGKIRAIRRSVLATEVTIGDAGAALARLRPAATYEKSSARDVMRALAGDAAVSVDTVDIDLPLASYVAHQGWTAAEHVGYLAQLGGGIAGVHGDGALFVIAWPEGQAGLALRYGRDLLEYEVRDLPGAAVQRMMIGFGGAGSAAAPDALRPSVDALPANAPAPGTAALWTPAPVLRVPKAAATASAGADVRAGAHARRVRARCTLLPRLRPGMVIEVQDIPDGLSGGAWIVTRVTHRLRPGQGGGTIFEGVSGESGGLGALLASALAAVGSLF